MKNNKRIAAIIITLLVLALGIFGCIRYLTSRTGRDNTAGTSDHSKIMKTAEPQGEMPTVPLATDEGKSANKNAEQTSNPEEKSERTNSETAGGSVGTNTKTAGGSKGAGTTNGRDSEKSGAKARGKNNGTASTGSATSAPKNNNINRKNQNTNNDTTGKKADGENAGSTKEPSEKNSDAIELPFVPAS